MYKILIGSEKSRFLKFEAIDNYEITKVISTPFGLYENIISNTITAHELYNFLVEFNLDLDENVALVVVVNNKNIDDKTKKQFYIATQKYGLYKNIIFARNHIRFESSEALSLNENEEVLFTAESILEDKINIKYDYGIYDTESESVHIVVPKNTPIEELVNFNKRNILQYKYYVDVEQVDFTSNRFILEIYEEQDERLYVDFKNSRTSGQYRVYFYLDTKETHMCISVLDILRNEWLDIPDGCYSSFLMR